MKTCSVDTCSLRLHAKGYCQSHYARVTKYGDPRADIPIRALSSRRVTGKSCEVENCELEQVSKGLCKPHYLRKIRHGDVQADKPLREPRYRQSSPLCEVESCDRKTSAKGLCSPHYERLRKHGDVLESVPFRGRKDRRTDANGYVWVRKPEGVKSGSPGKTHVLEHRLAMEQHIGRPLTPDETVHHINGDRADNRLENLELWSSRHPKGQRVEDKIEFALEILKKYRPSALER